MESLGIVKTCGRFVKTCAEGLTNRKNVRYGFGHGDNATISFFLNNNSKVTVKIYNIGGRLKKLLVEDSIFFQGMNALDWDGRDDEGHVCHTGLYIVTVETENQVRTKTVMIPNKY